MRERRRKKKNSINAIRHSSGGKPEFNCSCLTLLAGTACSFLLVNRARVGSVQLIRCAFAREYIYVRYMVREAFLDFTYVMGLA